MESKACRKCGVVKELKDFPKVSPQRKGYVTHRARCFECKRAQDRDYATKNVAKRVASSKAWVAKRRTTITYDEIPHGTPVGRASWECKCRPCVIASQAANSKARQNKSIPYSQEDLYVAIEYRFAIDNDPCFYCGAIKDKMETDHIVSLLSGGLEVWWNLRRSCKDCNLAKNNRNESEFLKVYLNSDKMPETLAKYKLYNKLLVAYPDRVIPFVMTHLATAINHPKALVQKYVRDLRAEGLITRKPGASNAESTPTAP